MKHVYDTKTGATMTIDYTKPTSRVVLFTWFFLGISVGILLTIIL